MSEKKHILIVEDSADLQLLLSQLFSRAGYSFTQSYDGLQALNFLKSQHKKPSVIILDLMMPVMDGAEFRRHQLNDPELAGIPVIVITADSEPEAKAKQMGVQHYFRKTKLDIPSLLQVVCDLSR